MQRLQGHDRKLRVAVEVRGGRGQFGLKGNPPQTWQIAPTFACKFDLQRQLYLHPNN